MKFNEKLIELRKKEGLSQEELGYKLNVTRQTVSKWELGQTTPEMEKLVEMGKIFNISVDELINESETQNDSNPIIEEQPIEQNNVKEKRTKNIIVIALIAIVVLIVIKAVPGFIGLSFFNKATDNIMGDTYTEQTLIERFFGLFERILGMAEKNMDETNNLNNEMTNQIEGVFNQATESTSGIANKIDVQSFNGFIEMANGTNMGARTKEMLDDIITSNKTKDKKIIVKYEEIETQDSEEIKNLKTQIKDTNSYEISFEYDENGYINKAIIENAISQFDVSKFNNFIEMYSGTKVGAHVTSALDQIITSNKTNERKITVKYNLTETQDENEIKNIKRQMGTFDNYEVTLEYDADGFINKAIIEKL